MRSLGVAMVIAVLLVGCGASKEVVSGVGAPTDSPIPTGQPTPESVASDPTITPPATEALPSPFGAQPDEATLDAMVLHLPDAPEGARIGDDSHCTAGFGTDGDTNPFLDIVVELQGELAGCFNQLESPGVFIDSVVVAFPTEDHATRAITPEVFAGLAGYFGLGCCPEEGVDQLVAATGPGVAAVEATSVSDSVAVVGWRTGALIGAVSVWHTDNTPGALAAAQALAVIQDERMRNPVPVPDDIDDDRLVGLDTAPFRTWWLGEFFAPPGLPTMELLTTYSGGGLAELDYSGIRIEIFDLATVTDGSQPDQILGVAAELFDSPCTVTVPVDYPDGDAVLLGRAVPDEFLGAPPGEFRESWGALDDDSCPEGEPNVWMATIDFDDGLLLRVNAPLCYNCLAPSDPAQPYSQPDGLRAVISGLMPYGE